MKSVLVACEFSGVVRDAFAAKGWNAWSCDLRPSESPGGQHYQGNVIDAIIGRGGYFEDTAGNKKVWDLIIAHPPCTYLTCSAEWAYKDGPYHQKLKPETLTGHWRREARADATQFVRFFFSLHKRGIAKRLCVENPVGVINKYIHDAPRPQYIQPYEFGEDASKKTGLWLLDLPELQPTSRFQGRIVTHKGKTVERWSNQTDSGQNRLSPSDEREKDRSVTYQGIADAMADQWGEL